MHLCVQITNSNDKIKQATHIGYSLPTIIYEAGFIIVLHTDEKFVKYYYHSICLFNNVNTTIIVLRKKR